MRLALEKAGSPANGGGGEYSAEQDALAPGAVDGGAMKFRGR